MRVLFLACLLLVLAACSRVTAENFAKIQDGMSEQEVLAVLGKPTESNSVTLLGISGTSSSWASDGARIEVRFVNGKVALKRFERTSPSGK